MASPDATPYIDLLLVDLDPQDLVDLAVARTRESLPEWQPREGNIEMLAYEGMSTQVAELIYAINRIPSSVVQVLLKLNGVEFDPGAQPTTTIEFTLNVPATGVPAGTSVRLELESRPGDPMVFTTTQAVTAGAGMTTVVAPAIGNLYTSEANGYPAGTNVIVMDALLNVESAKLASVVVDGRDEETDTAYFQRATQLFQRMTNTLVLPRQFVAAMLEEVYVNRAHVIDNYNPAADPDNNGPTGTDAGHLTLVAYGHDRQLTTTERDALVAKITDLASAQLAIHYVQPTLVPVNVNVTVKLADGYVPSDVVNNVQTMLRSYFNTNVWNWSKDVRRNQIISLVSAAAGVAYVETLTTPAADYATTAVAPLLVEGTFSVTVTL